MEGRSREVQAPGGSWSARGGLVGLSLGLALVLTACRPGGVRLPPVADLEGRPRTVSWGADTRAVVFVFLGIECPVSNRFLPELEGLSRTWQARGVRFVWVYPFPDETSERVREHRRGCERSTDVYRDPDHALARALGTHRTPEVVVLDGRRGKVVYRGRVNDQYRALGVAKPEPTRHDLAEALKRWADGREGASEATPAVGCSFRSLP